MIKGIFFDAAGVLYTRSGPTESFALDLLEKNGYPTAISTDCLKSQQALRSRANQGLVSHEEYWDQFLSMREVVDVQLRKSFTAQIIAYSNDVNPVPGGREALEGLKQRGFLLGIITDTMYPLEFKMRRLEKARVADLIDVIACSTVLGVHKPDPAVYRAALDQARLKPSEAVFVGHMGLELDGAHSAGMATIAINHDPDAKADHFCSSLPDLLNLPILQVHNGALSKER